MKTQLTPDAHRQNSSDKIVATVTQTK